MLDEYAVNIVAKFGDKVINKGVRRVAPDGKTMRVDVVSIDRDGKETSFFRVIFMNETEHAPNRPHSQTGHSIGRWDGDTLIVDTVKLTAGTLFNNGAEHTEDIHFVERFRLADPNTLVATQQFTDPGSFVGTAARVLSFTRGPDHVYPYDCDPTYGLAIESRQGPAAR